MLCVNTGKARIDGKDINVPAPPEVPAMRGSKRFLGRKSVRVYHLYFCRFMRLALALAAASVAETDFVRLCVY